MTDAVEKSEAGKGVRQNDIENGAAFWERSENSSRWHLSRYLKEIRAIYVSRGRTFQAKEMTGVKALRQEHV